MREQVLACALLRDQFCHSVPRSLTRISLILKSYSDGASPFGVSPRLA